MTRDWIPPSPLESVSTFWEFTRWPEARVRAGAMLTILACVAGAAMLSVFFLDSFVESGNSFFMAMVMIGALTLFLVTFALWFITTLVFWRVLRRSRPSRGVTEVIRANEELIARFRSG
jgi:membrane protein implicated in regulation of membrane protease activity